MTAEKKENTGYKKKFLYLDKFTDHLAEDQKWKKQAERTMSSTQKLLLVVTIVSVLAFILAVIK